MAEQWTDARLDAALLALAIELDVPAIDRLDGVCTARRRRPRWTALAAAAAVLAVLAAVAIPPARDTVARWFGVRIVRDDGAFATQPFSSDVDPLALDDAIARARIDGAALASTALGPPDSAGIPPEGGVVLAWREGDTTLWARAGDDDVIVVKRLVTENRSQLVDVGDYAVLIDGEHVLDTPSRRVAAGRVLWWLDGGRQFRLESDLDRPAMLAIGRALAGS